MCTIAGAKVQRNYNCYNVYFYECLPANRISTIKKFIAYLINVTAHRRWRMNTQVILKVTLFDASFV